MISWFGNGLQSLTALVITLV